MTGLEQDPRARSHPSGGPPERVRVTHSRTEATRRARHRPTVHEIDEQTEVGAVYMSSLIRSQRRLAATVCGAIAIALVSTAVLGALAPRYPSLRVLGVPLPWLVLGVLVYPVIIALGWYAVRAAERNERAFAELVRRR